MISSFIITRKTFAARRMFVLCFAFMQFLCMGGKLVEDAVSGIPADHELGVMELP
jgi:hypothetical protein